MKKIRHFIIALLLVFLFSGCLTTLYPIFHPDEAIFNEKLLGYWNCVDKNKKVSFIEFTRIPASRNRELSPALREISGKGYFVNRINVSGDITDQYFVFLVKIGTNFYLDYFPAELPSQKNVNRFYKDHYIKLHSNYRLDMKDNNHFEIRLFEKTFLDKLISDNKISIRHEVMGDKNLVTASTDELQKFIMKYGDNPDAFAGNSTYCSRIIDY